MHVVEELTMALLMVLHDHRGITYSTPGSIRLSYCDMHVEFLDKPFG
jgi:hypothetical protein